MAERECRNCGVPIDLKEVNSKREEIERLKERLKQLEDDLDANEHDFCDSYCGANFNKEDW